MAVTNAVAYFDAATIAAAIRFTRCFLVKCHFSKYLNANIRLGWKRMAVANAVAHYDATTIATALRFTRCLSVKCHFPKCLSANRGIFIERKSDWKFLPRPFLFW